MNPVLRGGVSIGIFQYEGSDTTHYYIENADGEEFEISHRLWDALLQADGTHPLNLPNNGSWVLPKLKRLGLVRTSRFVRDDGMFNRFILFQIGNRYQNISLICKVINAALPLVSVLIFTIGIYLLCYYILATFLLIFSIWAYYAFIQYTLLLFGRSAGSIFVCTEFPKISDCVATITSYCIFTGA